MPAPAGGDAVAGFGGSPWNGASLFAPLLTVQDSSRGRRRRSRPQRLEPASTVPAGLGDGARDLTRSSRVVPGGALLVTVLIELRLQLRPVRAGPLQPRSGRKRRTRQGAEGGRHPVPASRSSRGGRSRAAVLGDARPPMRRAGRAPPKHGQPSPWAGSPAARRPRLVATLCPGGPGFIFLLSSGRRARAAGVRIVGARRRRKQPSSAIVAATETSAEDSFALDVRVALAQL